jgi:hypothetical protein
MTAWTGIKRETAHLPSPSRQNDTATAWIRVTNWALTNCWRNIAISPTTPARVLHKAIDDISNESPQRQAASTSDATKNHDPRKVAFTDVRQSLPVDTPTVTAAQREQIVRDRRAKLQERPLW